MLLVKYLIVVCVICSMKARKGGEEVGGSFRRDLKLISEVQAPFRGVRKFFYVAFTAAAGISTFFTIPRLILAIQGGEGAPGKFETLQNLAINLVGICSDSMCNDEHMALIKQQTNSCIALWNM